MGPPARVRGRSAGRPKTAYRRWAYFLFRGVVLAALPAKKLAGCAMTSRHKKPTVLSEVVTAVREFWTPGSESAGAPSNPSIRESRSLAAHPATSGCGPRPGDHHATFSPERENPPTPVRARRAACRNIPTLRSALARWCCSWFRSESVLRPGSPVNAQARKLLSNGIRPSP